MIIFEDLLTGDELFTDASSFKVSEDEAYFIVMAKTKVEKSEDIQLAGANASAEEQSEEYETSSKSGLDIILNHDLREDVLISSKKDFQNRFKELCGKMVKQKAEEKGQEAVDTFKKKAGAFLAFIKGKDFKNLEFYVGPKAYDDAAVTTNVIIDWNDDGVSAQCYIFSDSIKQVKV